jgi:hypothetical protein
MVQHPVIKEAVLLPDDNHIGTKDQLRAYISRTVRPDGERNRRFETLLEGLRGGLMSMLLAQIESHQQCREALIEERLGISSRGVKLLQIASTLRDGINIRADMSLTGFNVVERGYVLGPRRLL